MHAVLFLLAEPRAWECRPTEWSRDSRSREHRSIAGAEDAGATLGAIVLAMRDEAFASADADRERVLEGLMGSDGAVDIDREELAATVEQLAPRWFVMRNERRAPSVVLASSRTTMCSLRGPMTRAEIREVVAAASSPATVSA